MTYRVTVGKKAKKQLKKMDKYQASLLIDWIENNLDGCQNPRAIGAALVNSEYWRYKVGQYRILADINDDKVEILLVKVGTRENFYN
ncbi:MAG: type II toxin-antitoxin system RelE/ParE family toxin [Lactobacillales bacterium]|jgi:mRNA interferase RelE/StbE|nr:type II toxin-antitoxin system RelE/ParE family toxin [Lactobacillales bacterium]